ncbi:hypothetical protein C7C46_12400 [Streptomyces tateyamensis]|uniref:Uncharacterized protein n=1 Tax=Streptomyces tateyamensis TaxID=565073 RepID=A0A2V4PAI2_9ACTN|nr:hypothetical protein C7C46_12400 [Streptomyces tateyamensis]
MVGRLQMGDFSPASLLCRIDTYAGSIQCGFGAELRDTVLDCMDELVMAHGVAELQPDESTIRVLRISEISPVGHPTTPSLDRLAAEQMVAPVDSISDLSIEPIDDFDSFLAAISSAREDG